MRSSKDRSALFDIRDNAALARGFVGTLTLIEFKTDRRAFMLRRAPSKSYQRPHGGLLPRCASAIPSFHGARSWVSETFCATIMMMSRKNRFGAPSWKTCRPSIAPSRQS